MPVIQASHPVFAPVISNYSPNKDTRYSAGIQCGNLLTVSVAENFKQLPRFSSGKSIFVNAAVSLNTSSIPFYAYEKMFGCIVQNNMVVDPPAVGVWGGFGYIEGMINMNCEFEVWVTWLKRVIFSPPPISAVSCANGSITLTTPSISGTAYLDGSAGWRERYCFKKPKEAIDFLKCKAGILK